MRKIFFLILATLNITACTTPKNKKEHEAGTKEDRNDFIQENSDSDKKSFLAKPTGNFGVGFQEFHFIDKNRCPDSLYSEKTKDDYSHDNPHHCREILVRVYYPTAEKISSGSKYYAPQIMSFKDEYQSYAKMLGEDLELDFTEIEQMRDYTREHAPISAGKFPIIFFSPGDNSSVQKYENITTNLASHGYIVVGINSPFLCGYNALPNGHLIKTSLAKNDEVDFIVREADILFVNSQIENMRALIASMDLTKKGIMGHSAGANAVVRTVSSSKKIFLAAIAFDADVKEHFQGFNLPFLHQLASCRYWTTKYGSPATRVAYIPAYELRKNNYLVGIVSSKKELLELEPDGPLYSVHASFTDTGTLQYTSVFQKAVPTVEKLLSGLVL